MSQSRRPCENHSLELARDARLHRAAAHPCAQRLFKGAELEEVVFGFAPYRSGAADHRNRVLQVCRRINRAAILAGVAVLIGRRAHRAGSFHIAIRQEHRGGLIVRLTDAAPVDIACFSVQQVHLIAEDFVLGGVRRAEIVHADQHVRQVKLVLGMDLRDQLLRGNSFGLRLEHDGRAVRVVRADVVALMAAQLLEPHPDVGLDHLEDMSQMQRAIGVGQRAGD